MPTSRTRGERAGLSRDRILDAALAMADRDGLEKLSMRRLGEELGVDAMTVYHHVPNKDALLDGLVERVLTEAVPEELHGPWPQALRSYAWALRAALLRHPGALPLAVTRPATTPATLRVGERGLELLREAGFPLGRALDMVNTLSVFVVGHTLAEVRGSPTEGPGSAAWVAGLDPADFPLLVQAAREGAGTSDEERFRFAVEALLSGFATP
jgi:AcrR family transcriptional regulator